MGLDKDQVINHFVHGTAAARYAAARPYFHPMVMDRIRRATGHERFERGLDVACGTGQSSRALAEICDRVDAIDVSADMLAQAESDVRIRYSVASAEELRFGDEEFDLAAVGLAFHWFDQEKFLREARRVLKNAGWLFIYNNGSSGEMAENAEFRQWAWEIYPKKFPAPPRKGWGVTAEAVKPFGFDLAFDETFENPILMSRQEFVAYSLTQTNVIAAVESGTMPIDVAAQWIDQGVEPFFGEGKKTMKFSGRVWGLRSVRKIRNQKPE
jgi:ubiquinone/menaquinone biosynthesis C-methylase UbiE